MGAKILKALLVLLIVMLASTRLQADQREIVPIKEYPWSTVGRVGFGHGWCSAVLIGPKIAATAAHCLWNQLTGRNMSPLALRFVVGWDRGIPFDGAGVTEVTFAPNWIPEEMVHYGGAQAGKDWALLQLDKSLGDEVGWVALSGGIKVGDTVVAVGYGEDRKHVAVAHRGCHIMQHLPTGEWLHNCDAVHGDSGGPVFSFGVDDQPRVVALTVARLGENLGGAVGVSDLLPMAYKLGAAKENYKGAR